MNPVTLKELEELEKTVHETGLRGELALEHWRSLRRSTECDPPHWSDLPFYHVEIVLY